MPDGRSRGPWPRQKETTEQQRWKCANGHPFEGSPFCAKSGCGKQIISACPKCTRRFQYDPELESCPSCGAALTIMQYQTVLGELQGRIATLESDNVILREQAIKGVEEVKTDLRHEFTESTTKLHEDIARLRKQIKAGVESRRGLKQTLAERTEELQRVTARRDSLVAENSRLREEIRALRPHLAELTETKQRLTWATRALDRARDQLEQFRLCSRRVLASLPINRCAGGKINLLTPKARVT